MHLFISYAHVDRFQVNQIVEIFRDAGHDAWFDHRLLPGQDWQATLGRAVAECGVFVYVLSPESLASEWCQWEFAEAVRLSKPILPIRLQTNVKLPDTISRYQYADFSEGPTTRAVAQLLGGIHQAAPQAQQPPPAPVNPRGTPAQAQTPAAPSGPSADDHLRTAIEKHNARDYLGALAATDAALRLKPDHAGVYRFRATIRHSMQDWALSYADANEAIRLKPSYADAYYGRGSASYEMGKYEAALSDYREAVRLDPQFGDAYFALGNTYLALGDNRSAIVAFTEAIRLKPAYGGIYVSRGAAFHRHGDLTSAVRDYQEAIRLNPKDWTAYDNLILAYTNLGDKGAVKETQREKKRQGGPS